MEQQLNSLLQSAKAGIQQANNLASIEALRIQYLGKKGELTELLKSVGQLSPEQKPKLGKAINLVKKELQSLLAERTQSLQDDVLNAQLNAEKIDITLSGRGEALGSLHPVTRTRERVVQLFSGMGFRVADGPEIEYAYYNFEALNIPAEHPARDAKDTFYFPGGQLLRTHTSSVQIREMEQHGAPIRLISLGRVYRRDSDQTHTPMFHQVEGLLIEKKCTFSDLKGVIHEFLNQFFETDLKLRFRPSYFPFTEPSAEVDIYKPATQDWLEVLGCGMVHPNVLRNVGVDPDEYTGFAFGMGLDRLAMLRYKIPDLRLLFTNDLQFLQQF